MFHTNRHSQEGFLSIPLKANKVLRVVLCVLFLILLRVWHLTVVQHEKKVEEGFRPRKRVVVEPASRGTIRDRFNTVLAANRIEYRLAVVYSRFRDIPAAVMQTTSEGNKVRRLLRKEYIHALSRVLSGCIDMPQERIEDLIHSNAAMNYSVPFVLRKDLTEEEYYALKSLEKDWVGIELQRVPKRYYPRGRVGAEVIGYTGSISQSQYQKIMSEVASLREYVARSDLVENWEGCSIEEARSRLQELQEKAYAINDDVGKSGLEAFFEEDLRGWSGRDVYFSDAKGNALRKLPGSRRAFPGKRMMLALSIELQEFAERILAQNERDREQAYLADQSRKASEPWIRGGSIVVVDPNSGDILTLASFPRFDPNDFVRAKSGELNRWIESENYLAKVWDQQVPLKRELWDECTERFVEEERWLTWDLFLRFILPPSSKIPEVVHGQVSIKSLVEVQKAFFGLVEALQEDPAEVMELLFTAQGDEEFHKEAAVVRQFCGQLTTTRERLLALDISRLVVRYERFQNCRELEQLTLSEFRNLSSAFSTIEAIVRQEAKKIFRVNDFAAWRKLHAKAYLQSMRREEREQGRYAKPYLEYLDVKEQEEFEHFWTEHKSALLLALINGTLSTIMEGALQPYGEHFAESFSFAQHIVQLHDAVKQKIVLLQECVKRYSAEGQRALLESLQSFTDLNHPLLYKYRGIHRLRGGLVGQDLAASFLGGYSPGFRSWAFRQSTIQGSIFKLVVAYTALKKRLQENKWMDSRDTRFFEIVDSYSRSSQKAVVGAFLSGEPIPQLYKGGRIPKSVRNHIGRVDLVRALETSSNPYFSLLASEYIKDPDELIEAARSFGYGEKSGITLPGEVAGRLPDDLHSNKTGLYSFAIGQHTLVATPLQTALTISAIVNGGKVLLPRLVSLMAGKQCAEERDNHIYRQPSVVRREFSVPTPVRSILLEGMHRVTTNIANERTGLLGKFYHQYRYMHQDFLALQDQFIGKTSTAESDELHGIDIGQGRTIYNHTWFGGVAFDRAKGCLYDSFGKPELVVVVYLRYGGYGKEAAPLAAQIVKKWRELKSKRSAGVSGFSS